MATKRLTTDQSIPFKNHNKFIVKRWKRFRVSDSFEGFRSRKNETKRRTKINRGSFHIFNWGRINDFSWVVSSNFSSWQLFRFTDKW